MWWGDAYDSAALSQTFTGATAGQAYFFTTQLNLPAKTSQGYCDVYFNAGSEILFSYNYDMSAQYRSVNTSGIFNAAPSNLELTVSCSDYSGSPTDIWASFDDVQLSVYGPLAGTSPIRPVSAEGIINNNFDSGTLSPWTTSSTTGRMDFNVVSGRAVITYSRIDVRYTSPSWIMQTLNKPSEDGQNVRIQADVWINIPNSGTTCVAQINGGSPVAWTSPTVGTSQFYHVDVSQTLTQGSTYFYLYGSCTGTGSTTSISFDNVFFTLNAF